jgi:Mg2+ and Co2+ transporter CorA
LSDGVRTLELRRDADVVRWVDVDVRAFRGRPAAELRAALGSLCPGVEDHMLEDLLEADLWPKRRRYGEVRAVSAAAVAPSESADAESRAGSLSFQVVEMLASTGWLLTCWHPTRTFTGSEETPGQGQLGDHRDLIADIEADWAKGRGSTAGDLGLMVIDRLVDSYPDVRQALFDWLESWELDLYRRCETDAEPDRRTLIELRALVFQYRKSLAPLNSARGKARTYWFADVTDDLEAERIDDRIDRALRVVAELSDRLRSALDLVQLQLAQVQGRKTERLQQKFELVAAVLLVPTLVAGAYGANTDFPGLGEGWGTAAMFVLMILGGAGTFLFLRRLRAREERAVEAEGERAAATPR